MHTNVWQSYQMLIEKLGCEDSPGGKKHHCVAPPPQPPFLPKEATPEIILYLYLMLTYNSSPLVFEHWQKQQHFLCGCPANLIRIYCKTSLLNADRTIGHSVRAKSCLVPVWLFVSITQSGCPVVKSSSICFNKDDLCLCEYPPVGKKHHFVASPPQPPSLPKEATP